MLLLLGVVAALLCWGWQYFLAPHGNPVKSARAFMAAWLVSDANLRRTRHREETRRVRAGEPHVLRLFVRMGDPHSTLLLRGVRALCAERYSNLHVAVSLLSHKTHGASTEKETEWRWAVEDARYLADLYAMPFRRTQSATSEAATLGEEEMLLGNRAALRILKQHAGEGGDASKSGSNSRRTATWSARKGATAKPSPWQWEAAEALPVLEQLAEVSDLTVAGEVSELRDMGLERLEDAATEIRRGDEEIVQRGHYLAAMLLYGGEWYWGVQRLKHLEARLNTLPSVHHRDDWTPDIRFDRARLILYPMHNLACSPAELSDRRARLKPLELFYSFRSPYSQLVLHRVERLVENYGVKLVVRPLLPMVMRGLPVSRTKGLYILHDAAREAKWNGDCEFGMACDPLGVPTERAFAVYMLARREKRELQFLKSWGELVWGCGYNAGSNRGMRTIVEDAGLSWALAKELLKPTASRAEWSELAETNRRTLVHDMGLWGVPALRYGSVCVWGQDQLWVLERHILYDLGVDRAEYERQES